MTGEKAKKPSQSRPNGSQMGGEPVSRGGERRQAVGCSEGRCSKAQAGRNDKPEAGVWRVIDGGYLDDLGL